MGLFSPTPGFAGITLDKPVHTGKKSSNGQNLILCC